MTALAAYLTEAVRHRWQPGVHDCCTYPGDWVASWGTGDPLAEWRGTYRSDAQAVRLITRAGGLLTLWERGLASIGLQEVRDLRPGDVGVVLAATEMGQEPVGALFGGDRWSFRTEAGLIFAPAVAIKAWGRR